MISMEPHHDQLPHPPKLVQSQVVSSANTRSATSQRTAAPRYSQTRYALRSYQPSTDDDSFLQRLPAKIREIQTSLTEAEANFGEKRGSFKEAEEGAEQAKTRFRDLGRDAQMADLDALDRREPQDWTSAALQRQADEIDHLAALKREALFAISELVEKQIMAKSELREAEKRVEKYREKMEKWEKLKEMARELEDDCGIPDEGWILGLASKDKCGAWEKIKLIGDHSRSLWSRDHLSKRLVGETIS
jgi:chromosome segregation ATPase